MTSNLLIYCWLMLVVAPTSLIAQVLHPTDEGSRVDFAIRNFGFTTRGSFSGLAGTIRFDPQHPELASFDVSISAASINTGNHTRDRHLRSDDYFTVDQYPRISIKSQTIKSGNHIASYILFGELTIKGITRKISIPFTAATAEGAMIFDGSFTVKRQDFQVGGDSISMADSATINLHIIAR